MHPHLFSKIAVGGKELKNRLTMAPLHLGYAGVGGTVSDLILEHYRLMAKSGVAMVVVENSTVNHPTGSGSNRTLRADTDDNMEGLTNLAATIKAQGTLACLQINHAGRFAAIADPSLAPSAVQTFGRMPRALTREEKTKSFTVIPTVMRHAPSLLQKARLPSACAGLTTSSKIGKGR